MPKGLFILAERHFEKIYGPEEQADIRKLVDIYAPLQSKETIRREPKLLEQAEVIFSGWGAPCFDAELLAHAPLLKAVFYGSGSIRGLVSDAFWEKGVQITSAYVMNGVPVAEFTLSQIIFCLKRGWHFVRRIKSERVFPREWVPGAYKTTIGIVSLGAIGRLVCEKLKGFDFNIIAYDPYVSPQLAEQLQVRLCSLDELFSQSDVVSVHAPWLKETENLIRGPHFASMKQFATFINTARGAVVCEPEMIAVLRDRPDLQAVLDVTHPEPPLPDSLLYTLPNVVLTPHIAGSMDNECRRMGRLMVDELVRYLGGQDFLHGISREKALVMA